MSENGVTCAVLMCHAPIVLPEIAGSRADQVRATTQGMIRTAQVLVAAKPDVVITISPHTPRHPSAWGFVREKLLQGNFAPFGAPSTGVELPCGNAAGDLVREAAAQLGIPCSDVRDEPIDHGAMVPLHFVQSAGWNGPTVLIALPYAPTHNECQLLGRAIAEAAALSKQRWAVLASGDMSHRLTPGAPSGFHPRAKDFDRFFVDKIRAGDLRAAASPAPDLRELAAEDVVDSVEIAGAACGFKNPGHEFISYEGPFGVGYLTAVLYDK